MRVLIFGASGSAGASVLKVCLSEPSVTSVRAIVRRPLAVADTKLEQVQHADFLDYAAVAPAFEDVQLCLYCLGVSVSQVPDESAYRRITRTSRSPRRRRSTHRAPPRSSTSSAARVRPPTAASCGRA